MHPTSPLPSGLARFSLEGTLALVTGSTRGLGSTLAFGLARAGARVVVHGRDPAEVDRVAAAFAEEGLQASGVAFDVTDAAAVAAGIDRIELEIGPLDVLVNNAGIQRRGALHELALEDWRAVIDTNLTAVHVVASAVARHMIQRRRGRIVNVASLMSEVARKTTGAYAAAKGGVRMLTKAMCVDWAGHGLQVNALAPGYFRTDLNAALVNDPRFDDWLCARTPAGRWGEPDELVGAAVFLASPAAGFINGQTLFVDGGVLASL